MIISYGLIIVFSYCNCSSSSPMVLIPKTSRLKHLVVNDAVKHGGKFTSWKCTIISHHFIVSHLSSSLSFPQLIALTISNPMVDVSGQGTVARMQNRMTAGCLVKAVLVGSGVQMIFNLDQVIVNGAGTIVMEVAVL